MVVWVVVWMVVWIVGLNNWFVVLILKCMSLKR